MADRADLLEYVSKFGLVLSLMPWVIKLSVGERQALKDLSNLINRYLDYDAKN
jgi:hypothetical protein